MAITKQTSIDQIIVNGDGVVYYREVVDLLEDGSRISQTFNRTSVTPGQDLSGVPQKVADICNLTWTSEVIAAYEAQVAAAAAQGPQA